MPRRTARRCRPIQGTITSWCMRLRTCQEPKRAQALSGASRVGGWFAMKRAVLAIGLTSSPEVGLAHPLPRQRRPLGQGGELGVGDVAAHGGHAAVGAE